MMVGSGYPALNLRKRAMPLQVALNSSGWSEVTIEGVNRLDAAGKMRRREVVEGKGYVDS